MEETQECGFPLQGSRGEVQEKTNFITDLRNRHSMTLRASWEGQQGWSGGRKLEHKGRCRPEPVLRFPSERQGRTGGNSLGLVGLNNFSRL